MLRRVRTFGAKVRGAEEGLEMKGLKRKLKFHVYKRLVRSFWRGEGGRRRGGKREREERTNEISR